MSNLINSLLINGYLDEQDTESAQGCYVGADRLWEGEMAAEKAIRAEQEKLMYIRNLKTLISEQKDKLAKCSPYHNKKRERIERKISELESKLKHIKNVI